MIIDANEGHNIDTFDVPGTYLHAKIPKDKRIIMKLRGDFVNIMCQVNPEYKQHVGYENGNKVLYLQVIRAIYGCIESALLWYNMLSITLIDFEINPYGRFVAQTIIEGIQ